MSAYNPMELKKYTVSFKALGSLNELQIFCDSEAVLRTCVASVKQEVIRIEKKYSRFNRQSIVSKINAAAGKQSILVDEETETLLKIAAAFYTRSNGLFDITSGALQKTWAFNNSVSVPTPHEIAATLKLVGWDKLEWNPPYISLKHKGMSIDLGGLGKEYAVDRAADICLSTRGVSAALINFAGDIRVVGSRPDLQPWRIGIRDPRNEKSMLRFCEISQGAIATSGDYERYKIVSGKRYCHIINPRTGMPSDSLQSVSVFAERCIDAGGACTTAFLLGAQEAQKYLSTHGYRYLVVDAEG